jgi:hypothetical protein
LRFGKYEDNDGKSYDHQDIDAKEGSSQLFGSPVSARRKAGRQEIAFSIGLIDASRDRQ